VIERAVVARDDLGRHGYRPSPDLGGVFGGQNFGRCRKSAKCESIRPFSRHLDCKMIMGMSEAQRDVCFSVVCRQKISEDENRSPEASFVHIGDTGFLGQCAAGGSLVRPELPGLLRDPRHQLADIGAFGIQPQLASDKLREVERAIEQYSQTYPRGSDDLQILSLRVVHLAVNPAQKNVRETQHGVEWRAELVTEGHQMVDVIGLRANLWVEGSLWRKRPA
jgi:hypothetical protein